MRKIIILAMLTLMIYGIAGADEIDDTIDLLVKEGNKFINESRGLNGDQQALGFAVATAYYSKAIVLELVQIRRELRAN